MSKMTIKPLIAGLLWWVSSASMASDQCTKGSEFEPPLCPLVLAKISKITIHKNAEKSPAANDPSVTCSSFLVTSAQIRRYFLKTKAINANAAHYTLDWSPCYASGQIFFSDGSHGNWNVDQFRRGSLVMSDGKTITLYCPQCQFRPFQY